MQAGMLGVLPQHIRILILQFVGCNFLHHDIIHNEERQ